VPDIFNDLSSGRHRRGIAVVGAFAAGLAAAHAGPPNPQPIATRTVVVQPSMTSSGNGNTGGDEGGLAGGCEPVVVSHTSSDFGPGEYVVQAGFIEGEIAATSFVLPADAFPVRIDLMEFLFATSNAAVQTTTTYKVYVWEGTPNIGGPIFTAASDGKILPHLVMPPGTTGVNIQILVDPDDPEQIYVADNGTQTVSIGIEIVDHNQAPTNQCLTPPSPSFNAFPTTDVDGLQQASKNWIHIVDCGIFGCPPGWKRFSDLSTLCRPTGDWVQRLTWTPTGCDNLGACCLGGDCELLDAAGCAGLGGTFAGVGTACGDVDCSETGPCCFESTGGCVQLEANNCLLAGGVPGPPGTACGDFICFPKGACCLPDGSCADGLSPEACEAAGGVFQGDGTSCSGTNCPAPTGAACFANGFCLVLTEADAAAAGADWKGAGTTCEDLDGDGVADACAETAIPGDFNGDGHVNGPDLATMLAAWGEPGQTDLNGDGTTNGVDLGTLLANWTG